MLISLLPCNSFSQEGEQSPLESLREILLYGIESEILEAVKNIKQSREERLNEDLLTLLAETVNFAVRSAVLDYFTATAYRGAEETALNLLEQTEVENASLIIALIKYLSEIKSDKAGEYLAEALDEQNSNISLAAIHALGSSKSQENGQLLLDRLQDEDYPDKLKPELILALGELAYKPALEELTRIAQNRDAERVWRMYACDSLGKIGDNDSIQVFKNIFSEGNALLTIYAASALSNYAMSEVEDLLIQGLKNSNVRVRIAAARGLANKDAKKAAKVLIYKARRDPEKKVRLQAIESLGQIGSNEAVDFLLELFSDKKQSPDVLETTLCALVDNHLNSSLRAIKEVIDREWPEKNQKIIEFIGKKLSQTEHSGLKNIFTQLIESTNFIIRIYAIRGMEYNRTAGYKAIIKSISTEDPHPAVRKAALLLLEKS
jgi:HEAT repeat protein